MDKILESLIASGPLALLLGVAVKVLWARLQAKEEELLRCKDDCAKRERDLYNEHSDKIEKLNERQLNMISSLNEALSSAAEEHDDE